MNPGTDWIEQGRRLLETLRSSAEAADGFSENDVVEDRRKRFVTATGPGEPMSPSTPAVTCQQ